MRPRQQAVLAEQVVSDGDGMGGHAVPHRHTAEGVAAPQLMLPHKLLEASRLHMGNAGNQQRATIWWHCVLLVPLLTRLLSKTVRERSSQQPK